MAKTSITSSIFFSKARLALSFLAVGTRGRESCMIIMRMSTAENDDDYDDGQNPCFGELESARFSRTHVVGKVILEKKDDDLVVRFVAYLLSCSFFWAFFSPITCPETLIK